MPTIATFFGIVIQSAASMARHISMRGMASTRQSSMFASFA
jgi:hypothetical protein